MENRNRMVVALVLTAALSAWTSAAELQVGAARVDITPPAGLPMWGYGSRHDKPNEGVLDPLFADAVVLAVGDVRIGIVGLDLGRAPTRKSFDALRVRLRKESNISHVFLVGSHTHHAPVIEIADSSAKVAEYVRDLDDKLASVLAQAAEQLRPARMATAKATVGFNRNRHSKLPDPPVDRDLTVVRFAAGDGSTIATLVNFTAHPHVDSRGIAEILGGLSGIAQGGGPRRLGR